MKLPELRDLLIVDADHNNGVVYVKNSTEVDYYISFLKAPASGQPRYYTNAAGEVKYAGTKTDFAEALKDHVGIELTYDLLAKLAYANREAVVGKNAEGNDIKVGDYLQALLTELRTTDGNGCPYAYFYNEDGKNWWAEAMKAWSDQVYTSHIGDDDKIILAYSDIWGADGVIRGKYFYYNTNQMPVKIDMTGDGIPDYTYENKDLASGWPGRTCGGRLPPFGPRRNAPPVPAGSSVRSAQRYAWRKREPSTGCRNICARRLAIP